MAALEIRFAGSAGLHFSYRSLEKMANIFSCFAFAKLAVAWGSTMLAWLVCR